MQLGYDINSEATREKLGSCLDISADGDVIKIGAAFNDGNADNAGHIRVYEYNTKNNRWFQRGTDLDSEATDDY